MVVSLVAIGTLVTGGGSRARRGVSAGGRLAWRAAYPAGVVLPSAGHHFFASKALNIELVRLRA